MKKRRTSIVFFFLFLFLMIGSFLLGQQWQRRQRPPWDKRSPKVGKKVPDIMIYDKALNKIPLSNLYNDTLLVIQWGGCT